MSFGESWYRTKVREANNAIDAIREAQSMEQRDGGNPPDIKHNPMTGRYELVPADPQVIRYADECDTE
jgi:hypothetical protein